ncbi:uncharacterized protein (DUF1800 family) [Roseiarcus fermentans]|uniref:Uncharacterized protein (DUF1800 family) n=1 Tax=Roseiarcus fermentans TaxID=1473586 RepID=A0A366FSH1_9HYPH|nr:DUF1800 family protein [Roseiarcus fermentans]RBP17568.1 uncharacterized protein (DUF1800 family) [Roseiarcus fermentans]
MAINPSDAAAVTAFNRFGLGARPGDLNDAARDPRGFLLEELWTANVALIRDHAPPSGAEALQAYYLEQQALRAERAKMAAAAMQTAMLAPAPPAGPGMTAAPAIRGPSASPPPGPSAASPAAAKAEPPKAPASKPAVEQAQFLAEAQARLQKQLEARAGFVERLVAFWSNHFAVSVAKSGELRAAAGPFEREAIRPHALGKFSALLGAAESHPAMILYLDNQNSIGPDAAPGKFAGRGLNENLAREIMELHTLGVGSGYTQADVAEFARGLTGWSVAGPDSESGAPGGFAFKPNWHEPGPRKILGKTYAEAGVEQGRAILDDLARHPATARHIATKLVRHFVADDPAPDLVAMLAKRFQDSDGDLAVVASALVSDDRAWVAPRVKVRTPLEFVVGAARATGFAPHDPGFYLQALNLLGMPLWQPSGPNGFPDMSDGWASPEGMKARLDIAWAMGQRMRGGAEPLAVLKSTLGETAASPETVQAVSRAESREQALALLFMAPEFQRR